MHASLRTSGKSRKRGLLHFNLKMTQRTVQLLRAFLAWEYQSWWITVKAEVCHYCSEMIMKAIVLYVFQGLFALLHQILFQRTRCLTRFTAASSADTIYVSGICFMTPAYVVWRWWLQVVSCGGQMRTRGSWEQLPRETGRTWPSWGTRPAAWFTWKCMTERVRKVVLFLYSPLRSTRGRAPARSSHQLLTSVGCA